MKTKTKHTTFLLTSRQLSIAQYGIAYTAMSELGIPAELIRLCRMILKKEDAMIFVNYRGISLMAVAYKVITSVLY